MIHFNWKLIRTYTVSILIPVALGAAVGLFISGSMDYETLNKPPLAPPAWLFPIVWTLLYVLMGVSYGMLAVKEETDSSVNAVYFGQLAVNLLWPVASVRVFLDYRAGGSCDFDGGALLSSQPSRRTAAGALCGVDAVRFLPEFDGGFAEPLSKAGSILSRLCFLRAVLSTITGNLSIN